MTVFWSVLTVIGALGATEASAVNWNEGHYAPIGIGDQLERGTVWQRGIREGDQRCRGLCGGVIGARDSPAWLRGAATAVPNPKLPAGCHSDTFASLSLLILLEVAPVSCGPAPHVSDDGLATLIHMHMFDADGLRSAVPQAT